MAKVTVRLPGAAEPVTLDGQLDGDRFSVSAGDKSFSGTIELTGPGEGWLTLDGQIKPFYMIRKQDTLHIWLAGRTFVMPLVDTSSRRGATGGQAPSAEIKAPMPGTVLKILAKPGDAVEAGQALVIMESMKMEMTLSAPQADTVAEVLCGEGQLVEMGTLLVRLEGKGG